MRIAHSICSILALLSASLVATAAAPSEALLKLDLVKELPVMKAIGVPQIAALLRGELTREQVISQASAATRQYAKRQMTWCRNQLDESWERVTA